MATKVEEARTTSLAEGKLCPCCESMLVKPQPDPNSRLYNCGSTMTIDVGKIMRLTTTSLCIERAKSMRR